MRRITLAAILVTTTLALAGCSETGGGSPNDATAGAGDIALTAASLSFDPKNISVEVGEDITIALISKDSLHDFTIDELGVELAADAGETDTVRFRVDEAGQYTFYCSVAGHRAAGMEGTLIVKG